MLVSRLIHTLDDRLARMSRALVTERSSLLVFLFHGLFESAKELESSAADPQQGITVEMFRMFVRYFKSRSYRFVSPSDLEVGLTGQNRCVLITFDDGYYNNLRALPVLEEFDVPAVFFIATANIKDKKPFWWDIVYREERRRGRSVGQVRSLVASYKQLKAREIETRLKDTLGDRAFLPVGDADRPFTPAELREFALQKHVFLGNHTRDHAILTNCSRREAMDQIRGAQDDIKEMTGEIPTMIAYPNGNVSVAIQEAAQKAGLQLGVGVRPGSNRLPLQVQSKEAMNLKRHTLWGDRGIESQCGVSRSPVSLYRLLRVVREAVHAGL
jgi:peptidoglycan/xylan/chitin deacetylase (PgdA/CDA1 family)